MKKVMLFLLCLMLSACTNTIVSDNNFDTVFANENNELKVRHNNYTNYIDYYLPSDMKELQSDELSYVFMFNHSRMIMDLNISGIINNRYYSDVSLANEGFFDNSKQIYTRSSSYLNEEDKPTEYLFSVYEYDDEYLLYLISSDLVFYGYADKQDLIPLSSKMLLMARTAAVKNSDIIANFSSKEVIDYEKKQVNLFEVIMPVNGQINEFLVGENKKTNDE